MKRSRLKPVSKQKALDNTKYRQAKIEWREKRIGKDGYLQCQFVGKPYDKSDGGMFDYKRRCINGAMLSPHHKKGRHGSLLWNQRYFMATCLFHHNWIENNKREARKRGYILYK